MTVIEELDTAVLELDSQNRIHLLNGAAEQCLAKGRKWLDGIALEQVRGIPDELHQAVEATRSDRQRRHLHECRLGGGLYDCNIQALENRHVLLELYRLEWERQRRQMQQLQVQTGMLDLLRRNLGHEIRNPLGGIRGAAQMMAAELQQTELGTLAELIIREVDRIDELIQRFGQPELDRTWVDIHQVIDEALDLLAAESGGLTEVTRDFDPSIPAVSADASALRQVFLNLVLNAHQAGASKIGVQTRIEHGSSLLDPDSSTVIRVAITDDGEGVPDDVRPMLFMPMMTGRRNGTGLGLALSQQIAAAHRGLLSYEDPGTGSRFSLRLPVGTTDTGKRHA